MNRKAGIYFNNTDYVLVDMEAKTVTEILDGTETEYELGGGGVERKLLYTNPDTTVEQSTATMFAESEIEGYQYLEFIVTNTAGSYEVAEWCEIAPLKEHSGQFVISMPINDGLFTRKIYRSSGNVKPSINVYKLGTTTEDRSVCIIKTVNAVKGV